MSFWIFLELCKLCISLYFMNIVKHITVYSTVIAYGQYLYFSSKRNKFESKSLEPITKRTHFSIWKRVKKYSTLADRFVVVEKRKIKEIL
jgi:hypothetical protein